VTADKTGDRTQVIAAAKELQHYVSAHMNTSTGRIALQTLYDQTAQAVLAANKPPNIDAGVYQAATAQCQPQLRIGGYRAWANCVADAVGAGSNPTEKVPPPNPDLYYLNFASTRWSPDAAGISVLICIVLIVSIVVRLITLIILRIILRFKYRAA
jgi:hypothetical protein